MDSGKCNKSRDLLKTEKTCGGRTTDAGELGGAQAHAF
jgi:hypothetical protein